MGKKSRSKRQRRGLLGIREQDLSPEIITALNEAEKAFWLLDLPEQHRSIDEMAEMCWNAGIEMIGQNIVSEIGDPSSMDWDAIKEYNERLIRAGMDGLLTYVCKELIPRARKFAALNEVYGNSGEGRKRAANETGFVLFPPPIAERLCAKYRSELLDLAQRSEAKFHVPHESPPIQLVSLILGLHLIDTHALDSIREVFDQRLNDERTTIEELGELILSMSIPVLTERLSANISKN